MNEVITMGVDLAKNVFQVHGVDAAGAVVVRRQLRRGQVLGFFKKQWPCLEIRPMRCLPPVEFCLGTRPIQAASSRPFLKTSGSVMEAARALAVIGPMPGMVSRRRLASFDRCQAWMCFSAA